jgi:hypothetical protein
MQFLAEPPVGVDVGRGPTGQPGRSAWVAPVASEAVRVRSHEPPRRARRLRCVLTRLACA